MFEQKLKRADDLLSAALDDELLMMNIEKGSYYSLNSVGARIWELLENPMAFDELVARLLEEYDISAETCRLEVENFVHALRARGLLT
ncbi:MAG: PqqD family peptide modification chaperone [Methylobacter sp.]|uniref:PqqD family peptide modification chaperone n=1 Tax=Methylobacter sp. TaxID=2051955 RepID=UPI002731CAFF|nr:PqqD family peptide modification chaperone [Methylobacter sp.]MDP1663589.1 PqqD family peptide modification chaperone [Methylobacter sp.]